LVKVVLLAEVMAAGASTVRVKLWTASDPTPLWAVKVIGKEPLTVGVPESTPPEKVTPAGRAPDSVMVGVGLPVAVTVNVPAEPFVKAAPLAEVMEAGTPTVRVKL